jgi:hypothetical protein
MEQEDLLKKLGWILKRLKIPYIITGGIAVVIWGRLRFTADIDVVVELAPQKISQLAKMLLDIDKYSYVDEFAIKRALERKGEFNFIHSGSGLKVDFWILKDDNFDRERIKRRIHKKIGGQTLYFSSPEDLILIKLQWYKKTESTRQLEDIESILKIQKKLDLNYIKRWAKIQSTAKILKSLLNKKD